MKILIACEESGVVRRAFQARGHEAWSCDLLPADDASPFHLQQDVTPLLSEYWGCIIAFPPCTDLCVSGARWFEQKRKDGRQARSVDFFLQFATARTPKWAIENPVGIMSSLFRKPDQVIQPWWFGHGETKATCLWLHNLPPLLPTNYVTGREQRIWKMPPGPDRAKLRSRTFQGVADAMAAQWG